MIRQGWRRRHSIATTELRDALELRRPDLVRDRRVTVFDDVFTGGHTLNEIARQLRDAGADRVCGVVLAGQPFRAPGG